MTTLKALLDDDFIAHHKIHVAAKANSFLTDAKQFDLDDAKESSALLPIGAGKASFVNDVHGEVEIVSYEGFIDQCKKPSSFLNGRKKCDMLMVHEDDAGYVVMVEVTSSLGGIENLSKPIQQGSKVLFPGGKYEKCEAQLSGSLNDLMSVPAIKTFFEAKSHRVCLMAYKVEPHTDSDYLLKHPFERYLSIESKATAEDGALLPSPSINLLGFEYRRISHEYAFCMK